MNNPAQSDDLTGFEIAVTGMACRFPGAGDIDQFRQNVEKGVESITFFTDKDLTSAGIDPALLSNPDYVKAGGILKDIDAFDAAFFGYNPKEAEVMDPQQRLFLELAWTALEDAGYDSNTYNGLIGMFAGAGTNTYIFNLYSNREISESIGGFETLIGNAGDHLCTRTAYKLNLEGPAVAVQTACSTSLAAVHLACQSLISGDCDMALAGGVSLHVPQETGHLTQEGWIVSPDGHCRAFDARAKGTVNGSGLGMVVLKRLPDAVEDGDCIHAVIKGSAINNDGAMKIGYTAPRVEGQAKVIRAAQLMAEVDAGTIGYIEAHGTGTELGDPIEILALTQAFRETTDKKGFCAIGSVKSNIGHLDTSAGVAGLIKTVLCLEHRLLPPSLHFENPNPKIDFENSPFYVIDTLRDWPSGETPRRAGVSSFGMGGTNVHVILEEYKSEIRNPKSETNPNDQNPNAQNQNPPGKVFASLFSKSGPPEAKQLTPQLIILSAKTGTALDRMTANLAEYLKKNPHVNMADAAYTLQVGRRSFEHRRFVVCRDAGDARTALEERHPKRVLTAVQEQEDRPVVFMFPGQGAQYAGMAGELYRVEPVFRQEADRCFDILRPLMDCDLRQILYPELPHDPETDRRGLIHQARSTIHVPAGPPRGQAVNGAGDSASGGPLFEKSGAKTFDEGQEPRPVGETPTNKGERLGCTRPKGAFSHVSYMRPDPGPDINQTAITQPLLFTIEYALARLLMSWGISPCAMAGHSIGEYVAACISGVLSLEDALTLVARRGQLMQSMPGGAMLGIPLPETEVQAKLTEELSLAAVNGPKLCVVSGPTEAVDALQRQLNEEGLDCSRLHTSHAFHSIMMEPAMEPFKEEVKKVDLKAPAIPYLSNLTGTWMTAEDTTDENYWADHLRRTVRFSANIEELVKNPDWILLELGPGRTLSTLCKQHPGKESRQVVLSSLRHPKEPQSDEEFLLAALGRLWLAGAKIDWYAFHAHERRLRLPLPTYPFERRRYWVALKKREAPVQPEQKPSGKKEDMADWFYQPVWRKAERPTAQEDQDGPGKQMPFPPGWILFVDECGSGEKTAARLKADDQDVTIVRKGETFQSIEEGVYTINPRSAEDYETLFAELSEEVEPPWRIMHLWGVTPETSLEPGKEAFAELQYSGFYSLLFMVQTVGKQDPGITENLRIGVVTNNMQKVSAEEIVEPGKATVLGACKVIPKEYPGIACCAIDILLPETGGEEEEQLTKMLINELSEEPVDTIVAIRGSDRYVQTYETVRLTEPVETASGKTPEKGEVHLREGGTYLITGGLGGMGLTFAGYLARTLQARLILLDRLALPERDRWQQWLTDQGSEDQVSRKIKALSDLEAAGAEVMAVDADAADEKRMKEVIAEVCDRFGDIHGVIHTAGIAGGGMIRLRTRAEVEEVFAAKVTGLYVLAALLKDKPLDFMVLCSSLTSILGEFGQVDYCAANIFLDSFALHHAAPGYPHTVSINWDTWKEVGMAAAGTGQQPLYPGHVVAHAEGLSKSKESSHESGISTQSSTGVAPQKLQVRKVDHPLLDTCSSAAPDRVVYETALSAATHWPLSEHRLNGTALLPGTAYIEMVRAAFADHTGSKAVEIKEITFIAPLLVPDDEVIDLHTILTRKDDHYEFVVHSGGHGPEHARGMIADIDKLPPAGPPRGLGMKTRGSFEKPPLNNDDATRLSQFSNLINGKFPTKLSFSKDFKVNTVLENMGPLTFGPRWQRLVKRAGSEEDQAFAHLELPEEFAGDLEHYSLHPALLDAAGSFAAAAKGAYFPFSYKNMKIYGPLPRDVYSHIEWQKDAFEKPTLHLHVIIMDSRGKALIEIEGYTLRPHMRGPAARGADKGANKNVTNNEKLLRGGEGGGFLEKSPPGSRQVFSEDSNYRLEIGSPGILDTLVLRPEERRQSGPGEVEIRVKAVGLNFKDILMALSGQPGDLSSDVTRFGSECVGEITAVGEGVEGLEVGDEVIAAAPACFCSYLTTSADYVVPRLAGLGLEEAATISIAFMTAYYALHHLGGLRQGERVLIHAAAGGVGQAAVQIAQQTGAEIFATAGSPEKREFLHSLGIPYIMDSRTLDFAEQIREYTNGGGVDVVLNSLAGEFMVKSLESLAPFGRFLEIGKRDIYREGEMNLKPFQKGLSFFSIDVSPGLPAYRSILLEVMDRFKKGALKPLPHKVFPITEVKQAFDYMARAQHTGKIVISMQDIEAAVEAAAEAAASAAYRTGQLMPKAPGDAAPAGDKKPGFSLINLEDGITSAEGVDVLRRVLGSSKSRVIVSTRDLQQRIEEQQAPAAAGIVQGIDSSLSAGEQHARPALPTEYVAPRNEKERLFAAIWQEVLGIDQVGIYDNFFDLGGASLQSIQVVAKAKEAGIDITPEMLFEFPTIAEHAARAPS